MSRLTRLSTRAYGRLTPERQRAVDILEFGNPGPAERGEAKTVLGWRRNAVETDAYARRLLAEGLGPMAVADTLGVSDRYLRRMLDREVPYPDFVPRNPSVHAAGLALTDRARGTHRSADSDAQNEAQR